MIRCYKCAALPKHLFRDCLSKNCGCNCVRQLYDMRSNKNFEKVSNNQPRFMDIKDAEINDLPALGHAVTNFNKIHEFEWVENEDKKRYRGRCRIK